MNLKKDYTNEAAEHFGIPFEKVTNKHRDFIKAQLSAENYGHKGVPKRAYQIYDNGVVEFIHPVLTPAEQDLLAVMY